MSFFFGKPIDYLDHLIAPGQLQVAQKTIKAIRMLQYFKIVSELGSFWVCVTCIFSL